MVRQRNDPPWNSRQFLETRASAHPSTGWVVSFLVDSAVSENNLPNLATPGNGPNPFYQQRLAELKFLPDHRVVNRHHQTSAPFDPCRVGKLPIGLADDLAPGIADRIVRRRHPDAVSEHDLINQIVDTPGLSNPRSAGIFGQTSEIRDQIFDSAGERSGWRHRVG